MEVVVGNGQVGYEGDVEFDFTKFPHRGPVKKKPIQTFPQACHDVVIVTVSDELFGE